MVTQTPRLSNYSCTINGERYFVAVPDQRAGAREWEVSVVPASEHDAGPEQVLRLRDFSQGSGYSFADRDGVYEKADGWDASAPGKVATWPVYTTLTAKTTAAASIGHHGYLVYAESSTNVPYVYCCRGNFVTKYAVLDNTAWTVSDHNLTTLAGATRRVCGQPTLWKGYLFVPVDDGAGTPQRFWRITVGAGTTAADTATQGPVAILATHLVNWKDKLVRLESNGSTKAVYADCDFDADPMTATNWGREYTIGDQGRRVTGASVYDRYLIVGKQEGLYSFDESANPINELVDLENIISGSTSGGSSTNCRGMEYAWGKLLVPHIAGLVSWSPGAWQFVGPEQDGYLDASSQRGWGYVRGLAPYGRYCYVVAQDRRGGATYLLSFKQPGPGDERGPIVPHMHQDLGAIAGEDAIAVTSASGQVYLVVMAISTVTNLRDTVTPQVYELPEAGFSPSNDSNIAKHIVGATDLKVRFNITNNAGTSTGFTDMSNSAGGAVSITTTGLHRIYFPSTSSGVGVYCQLRFLVGTKNWDLSRYSAPGFDVDKLYRSVEFWAEIGDSAGNKSVVIRTPITLRYSLMPKTTRVVQTTLVFGPGQFEDGGMMVRTPETQESDLRTVVGPNSAVISIRDPYGETFKGRVVAMSPVREVRFTGHESPTRIAQVTLRELPYA